MYIYFIVYVLFIVIEANLITINTIQNEDCSCNKLLYCNITVEALNFVKLVS